MTLYLTAMGLNSLLNLALFAYGLYLAVRHLRLQAWLRGIAFLTTWPIAVINFNVTHVTPADMVDPGLGPVLWNLAGSFIAVGLIAICRIASRGR